jgi:GT2 family glycosyltransferase
MVRETPEPSDDRVGRSPMTALTVVVVSYNSAALLPDFFSSLAEALDGVPEAHVVLSDNASSDDSIAIAQELWPGIEVVSSSVNAGYAAAINAGVAAVDDPGNILVVNDDIRLARGTIAALLAELEFPDVGVVVPRLVDGSGTLLRSQRREPTLLRALGEALIGGTRAGRHAAIGEVVQDELLYEAPTDVAWASGCAWLISERCWHGVGSWDESLFLYGEDLDYAQRVRDAGLRLRYTPETTVVHLVGPSHRDPRLWSMLLWNRYRVYRRRHGALSGTAYRAILILNEAIRSVSGSAIHRAGLLALLMRSRRPPEVRGR